MKLFYLLSLGGFIPYWKSLFLFYMGFNWKPEAEWGSCQLDGAVLEALLAGGRGMACGFPFSINLLQQTF